MTKIEPVSLNKDSPGLWQVIREVIGRRDMPDLPRRVRAAIAAQEQSGEVLVKLIQLLVSMIWALLYFFAPRTDLGTDFSPVPYALAIYIAINAIGLMWALHRGLPNFAVYLSILFDVAMLMLLIWSFHLQYRQPPSFYLKAPALLYIFIFIALRALRFQARFVIAAGLAAALGWLILTLYVVMSNANDTMITHDYVHYMTSNSVLLGAEIDKMVSILLVTGILALAIKQANDLLVTAVSGQQARRDLSRFFDSDVAERIITADADSALGQGVRREASIVYVDIRGFTASAATMEPGQVVANLTAYQRRVVRIIQAHHGTIDKFLGDGIMASFGAVSESQTHAADAMRAIDAIITETATWPDSTELNRLDPRRINAALATGPVVFGTLGGEERLEYTTIGAAVNLAAKLEKHNKEIGSRVLCDQVSWDLAKTQGYHSQITPQNCSGPDIAGKPSQAIILHP